ncbi:exo-beta-N-acetylmuramidase NamZ family protein [Aggregatilinea lenta]|uniref:exo-beta-N-acetylmuramidase NamZ family protein n=1 Tax=Aggregatilinea lenta TaxID=913108 RepID=UPI000E5A5414|nr:DUF1343 domain-containing protein [Aggregatilinea lenta]
MSTPVYTGLEVLQQDGFRRLAGLRVGLMTNPSAVDRHLNSTYRLLSSTPEVQLVALFSPEHGFLGAAPDAEQIASATDSRTGLPVYSLYGATFGPTAAMLEGIDVLVCDIQDIGVRFYTYAWTVSHILEAAGAQGVGVMILDRPNPLGGMVVDGPPLNPDLSSLVGRFPVPVRHGLTLSELAHLINTRWNAAPADLTTVRCANWTRSMTWDATGLPWVPPSPGMPHMSALWHYPGACLIEGTELSEGRGTALPFEIVGAPWVDALDLAEKLNAEDWAAALGARFRPHTFLPTQSKWAGDYCGGVQVYITDPERWRPIHVWLGAIITIYAQYPEHFHWLAAESDTGMQHFDRLIGSARVRHDIDAGIQAGRSTGDILSLITAEWDAHCHAFALERSPFLLYD